MYKHAEDWSYYTQRTLMFFLKQCWNIAYDLSYVAYVSTQMRTAS